VSGRQCSRRRPHFEPVRAAIRGEQVAIKRIVGVVEEGTRATIAALGHMVRMIGKTIRASRAMWHDASEDAPSLLSALSP
jgi:hypothetical protein